MQTIRIELGECSYPVWTGRGLLGELPRLLEPFQRGQKWVLITQRFLQSSYGEALVGDLTSAGYDTATLTIPTGEGAKTLAQAERLYNRLVDLQGDRNTTLLAFGGGVVGDLTGFVAATFLRGVDYIQLPTTLLAMVDSALGGKTGVNLPRGKNLVGAIYQPRAVVADPEVLASLPPREVVSGFVEVLKYGAIRDGAFFQELEQHLEGLITLEDKDRLEAAIARSCAIKAAVVAADEREGNLRRILNFGHTVGHALETILGYGKILHGEAVAYGMLCAGHISHRMGLLKAEEHQLLDATIRRLPLPGIDGGLAGDLLEVIQRDKKVRSGQLHYVLLEGLGKAVISDQVGEDLILEALRGL